MVIFFLSAIAIIFNPIQGSDFETSHYHHSAGTSGIQSRDDDYSMHSSSNSRPSPLLPSLPTNLPKPIPARRDNDRSPSPMHYTPQYESFFEPHLCIKI